MKLHYWSGGNFGDDLNLWLWKQLFSKPIDHCFSDDVLFLGIGTILNNLVPEYPEKKVVFGAGFGYGSLPHVTDCWHFYCVRGPLTARVLGLPENLAISDSALLIRELIKPAETSEHVAFMPHHNTANRGDWKSVCDSVSIRYIDPRASVPDTLDIIRRSSLLITEAMHGAIVADALRIPWIPVRTRTGILDFKWRDWSGSLELDHGFELLPPIFDSGPGRLITPITIPLARQRLRWLAHNGRRRLSRVAVLRRVYERLVEAFNDMVEDERSVAELRGYV